MATKLADRVKETSTTTGTGTYSLAGAVTGFQAFSDAFVTTDVVYYCAEDGANWEIGEGTLTTGTPWTLARTTILASSNADAAVNWAAGTRKIFCTAPTRAVTPYFDGPTAWTPVLSCVTPGTLAVTYTTQLGRYFRIGNLFVGSFNITVNTITVGTGTGEIRITGLPFTSASQVAWHGAIYLSTVDMPTASPMTTVTMVNPSTNYIIFRQPLDNTGASASTIGGVAANDILQGTISFEIA